MSAQIGASAPSATIASTPTVIGTLNVPAGTQKVCVFHVIDDNGGGFDFQDMRYDTDGGDDLSFGAALFNSDDDGVTVHRPVAYYEIDVSARSLPETVQISGILDGADSHSWVAFPVSSDSDDPVFSRLSYGFSGGVMDDVTNRSAVVASNPSDKIVANFALNAVTNEVNVLKQTSQVALGTRVYNNVFHNAYLQDADAGANTTVTFGQDGNASAQEYSILTVAFYDVPAVTLDVEDVDGDELILEGQTNITIADSENLFEAAQGTGSIEIDGIAQAAINSWAAGAINFDHTANSNRFGFQDLVVKTDSSGDYAPIQIDIQPNAGTGYVDITDVSDHDLSTSPDLKVTDQPVYDNLSSPGGYPVAISAAGKVTIDGGGNDINGETFDYKVWDRVTKTYGTAATFTAETQPAIQSAAIDETSLVAVLSRNVVQGAGFDINDFSLTIDAVSRTLTLDDLTGAVLTFSYSGAAVTAGQTVLFSLVNSVDGLEATDNAQDAEDFTDFAVTNNASAPDTTPDAYSFTDAVDVEPGALTVSNTLTLAGTDATATVTVTNGEVSIEGGAFTAGPTTIEPGETFAVRGVAGTYDAVVDVDLDIGGVPDTFSITTRAEDTIPNAFGFVDQGSVALSTPVESNIITPDGFESAPISITGGEYRLDGGAYTSAPGTITQGQTVQVRHTSSGLNSTATDTVLTIGTVSDTFTSTTVAANPIPVITGSANVSVNENQTAVASYSITERDGQTPTLTGPDSALFSLNAAGGDGFDLVFDSAPDFEAPGDVGADNIYNVTINIDDGVNTPVTLAVAVTVLDLDEVKPLPVLSYAGGTVTGAFQVFCDVGEVPGANLFGEGDYIIGGGSDDGINAAPVGTVYTIDVSPPVDSSGNITIDVPADVYNDAAGNLNVAATQLVVPYDTRLAAIISVNGGSAIVPGSTIDIVTFQAGAVEGVVRLFRNNTHYPVNVVSWADDLISVAIPAEIPAANDYQLQVLFG